MERCAELQSKLKGHLRFTLTAWAIALPIMYASLVGIKVGYELPDRLWTPILVFPLIWALLCAGGMWLAVRTSLANIRRQALAN
jgi:hypothetical protein